MLSENIFLIKGNTMPRLRDLITQRFGRLTVFKRAESGKWGARWLCKCDCGKLTTVSSASLIKGNTKSCGCLLIEKVKERATGENNHLWMGDNVKYHAAHLWIRQHKPKPALCEMCKEREPIDVSFNGKNGQWTRRMEDYQWLCESCHRLKDAGRGARPLTKARVHRIREFYRVKAATQQELAEMFKVDPKTIQNIIYGRGIYKVANRQ